MHNVLGLFKGVGHLGHALKEITGDLGTGCKHKFVGLERIAEVKDDA